MINWDLGSLKNIGFSSWKLFQQNRLKINKFNDDLVEVIRYEIWSKLSDIKGGRREENSEKQVNGLWEIGNE